MLHLLHFFCDVLVTFRGSYVWLAVCWCFIIGIMVCGFFFIFFLSGLGWLKFMFYFSRWIRPVRVDIAKYAFSMSVCLPCPMCDLGVVRVWSYLVALAVEFSFLLLILVFLLFWVIMEVR